jgi:small subunit ribosomal protein S24e
MEIIDRKENPLLNRVEIEFRWNHDGSATPSRQDMLNGIASIEPGSNRDLIIIKNVNTRFGTGSTTGLGIVYADETSMKVEPDYIHARFEGMRTSSAAPAEEAPAEKAPAEEAPAEEAPAEEAPAEDGGEA